METWTMEKAKRARKAETPKQTSHSLRLRAPYLYPDPTATLACVCSSRRSNPLSARSEAWYLDRVFGYNQPTMPRLMHAPVANGDAVR